MDKSKIYICHTYYHVLISIIKEISSNANADIVICDTIPEGEKIVGSLKKSGIFKNVFEFSEKKYKNNSLNRSRFGKLEILFINSKYKKMIKPSFQLNKDIYKEVNIFNDWTYLGYYLRANKIYYNLLEDAKDSYKVLENYVRINYKKPLLHKFFGFALETSYFHGKSKYSKVVEVNDDNEIKIPKEKIRVNNKNEMFSKLAEGQLKSIYSIFTEDEIETVINKNSILILSQPLYEDSMVQTEEYQKKVYQDIIDQYCKDVDVYIKPHPRDNFDYGKEFCNVKIINKNIPTEILNFNPNIKFKKAITVSSSSINGIDFVDEKIYLGFDWLKNYNK